MIGSVPDGKFPRKKFGAKPLLQITTASSANLATAVGQVLPRGLIIRHSFVVKLLLLSLL